MKNVSNCLRAAVSVVAILGATYAVGSDVNVRVTIGDPAYYGPLDVSGYAPPRLIYAEPVVVQHVQVVRQPVYVRVPVSEARNWRTYCGRYSACDRPVYFVQDTWYNDVYAPQYRTRYGTSSANQARTAQSQQRAAAQDQKLAHEQAKLNEKQAKHDAKQAEHAAKEQAKIDKEQAKLAEKQAKLNGHY